MILRGNDSSPNCVFKCLFLPYVQPHLTTAKTNTPNNSAYGSETLILFPVRPVPETQQERPCLSLCLCATTNLSLGW